MKKDIIAVIGSGPAGIAACIQLHRYGLDFILFERNEVGGLLRNANCVENYPGFPQGISGLALVQIFHEHMNSLGIQIVKTEVTNITFIEDTYHLNTHNGEYSAQYLIIASGTKPRTFIDLSIPLELHSRVYYEICPIINIEDSHIAIIGAGDAAFDYALNMARHNQVSILNRGSATHCLPLLVESTTRLPNISYYSSTQLQKIIQLDTGNIGLTCDTNSGVIHIEADYLIGALGRDPHFEFLSPISQSSIKNLEKRGRLHWIGDVKNGRYRQTAIATGDGIQAAMVIANRVKEVS